MDPQTIAEYLAFGLFGGVIGGLLGVGGSIGIIPLATIFISPDKQQLQGAAMITNLVVVLTISILLQIATAAGLLALAFGMPATASAQAAMSATSGASATGHASAP